MGRGMGRGGEMEGDRERERKNRPINIATKRLPKRKCYGGCILVARSSCQPNPYKTIRTL